MYTNPAALSHGIAPSVMGAPESLEEKGAVSSFLQQQTGSQDDLLAENLHLNCAAHLPPGLFRQMPGMTSDPEMIRKTVLLNPERYRNISVLLIRMIH